MCDCVDCKCCQSVVTAFRGLPLAMSAQEGVQTLTSPASLENEALIALATEVLPDLESQAQQLKRGEIK